MPVHSSHISKRAANIWHFLHEICPKCVCMTFQIRQYILPSAANGANSFSIIPRLKQLPVFNFVHIVEKLGALKSFLYTKFASWQWSITPSIYCQLPHQWAQNSFLMFQMLFNRFNFIQ